MSLYQSKKPKILKGYHWHHIVPKHLGGSDDLDNLILLSLLDHAIAHFVRYKIEKNPKDAWAYNRLIRTFNESSLIISTPPTNLGKRWSKEINAKKGRFGNQNAMSRPEIKKKHYQAVLKTAKTGAYSNYGSKNPASKPITLFRTSYACINDAAKALNKNRCTIREWIKKQNAPIRQNT
jgi:hypothetical protein